MGETTKIEWADSTVSIWEGCQETGSPACVGCYAKARNLRYAPKGTVEAPNWGPHAPRREVKSWRATLRKISRLAAAAFAAGRTEPWFVFVNSLSDFWDNQADPKLRAEALFEFAKHPHLTFLLLTKRPQNIIKMWKEIEYGRSPADQTLIVKRFFPRNVAIGCTVVTQPEANRDIPHLLHAKAMLRPAFAFVSMEPLAEIVDLTRIEHRDSLGMKVHGNGLTGTIWADWAGGLDWVITGGCTDQGKHKAYPTPTAAFRRVRDDCAAAGVPYLHKQNGEWLGGDQIPEDQVIPSGISNDCGVSDADDNARVWRVGKKFAGRMLDGRTHDARPKVAA